MIEVIYYRNYNKVTVNGHACSGEPGHDLVCSAASILAYTLAANVGCMAEGGKVREPVTATFEGMAEISCKPISRLKASVTMIFDAICAGFELLAQQYPENIHYEIHV